MRTVQLDPFILHLSFEFKFLDFKKTKLKFIDFEKTKLKFRSIIIGTFELT